MEGESSQIEFIDENKLGIPAKESKRNQKSTSSI